MGRTHEALIRAEREQNLANLPLGPVSGHESFRSGKPANRATAMERYGDIRSRLLTSYPERSIRTILFTGADHGNGVSTTAANYAVSLAAARDARILLVDVNLRTPGLHEVFRVEPHRGLTEIVNNGESMGSCVKSVGTANLSLVTCGRKTRGLDRFFSSESFDRFLYMALNEFDFVILDAPPAAGFPEARVLSSKVDGVILVIESGRTRGQTALRAKKELTESGGKLLGVVLNRKKYVIPDWIYRRLQG